jgi:hypothetical protein
MQLSNSDKINLFLALSFLAVFTCRQLQPKIVKDDIIVDNIHIDKKPCVSTLNELFGKGIDSSKICDCLIPSFYKLVKDSSSLVAKFKESYGFFELEQPLKDSFILTFGQCAKVNILDSNYILKLTPANAISFKEKFKKAFISQKNFENINVDILSGCIVEKLNGNITIGEFFAEDYLQIPKIRKIMTNCMDQSTLTR